MENHARRPDLIGSGPYPRNMGSENMTLMSYFVACTSTVLLLIVLALSPAIALRLAGALARL